MSWYIFATARGWAALHTEHGTVNAAVLPCSSSPEGVIRHLEKYGLAGDLVFLSAGESCLPVIEQFQAYYQGEIISQWEATLNLGSLPVFTRRVLLQVYTIPYGRTMSYGEVARLLDNPAASRAVGQVMARNPIPLIIPCHRVVAAQGPGGFSSPGGVSQKEEMLAWEQKNFTRQ